MLSSPYPEVRAVVSDTDDPDMLVSTFRAWLLSMVFVMIGTGVSESLPCLRVAANLLTQGCRHLLRRKEPLDHSPHVLCAGAFKSLARAGVERQRPARSRPEGAVPAK